MNRRTITIIVFGLLILATACVQQDLDPLAQSDPNQTSEQGDEEIQLQYEGIGPLEITPQPEGGEDTEAPSAAQVEGNISSSGNRSTSESIADEPGYVDSVAPQSLSPNLEQDQSVEWLTYIDQAFSYSINYPSVYLILPETASSKEANPVKVNQVLFQDIQLATGDTAEFELPNFTIEVFELGDQTLEMYIAKNEPIGVVEEYQLNSLTGFRVYYNQLIAPNEFYFFSANNYVYKLTPLGLYSQDMLASFQVE